MSSPNRLNCRHPDGCFARGAGHCRTCHMAAVAARIHSDPAVRAKMSEASKKAWADPAVRAKMSEASKKALADPAVRAKMSEASKKAWADPAVRAKMSEASKKAWADPAVRAKMSEASKKALADPAVRAKMSEASKKAWADKLAWCPDEYLDEYQFLKSKLGAREAKEIIADRLARQREPVSAQNRNIQIPPNGFSDPLLASAALLNAIRRHHPDRLRA